MKTVKLKQSSPTGAELNLKYCDTFLSKLLGLMFSKQLDPYGGIIMVESQESTLNTSIHMLFMNYDITTLWLDKDLVIVDKVLAKRWRPFYKSQTPAQYVVELHRDRFPDYQMGDQLQMQPGG